VNSVHFVDPLNDFFLLKLILLAWIDPPLLMIS
jgi:hypothetical protein